MTVPIPGPPRPAGPRDGAGSPPATSSDPAAEVATAMAALDGLGHRPLADHVDAFERVHAVLGEALAGPV